jgi:hypothetical protein
MPESAAQAAGLPAAAQASPEALALGFTASDIDCTTTVMLKILDGKCKMNAREKPLIAQLYDAVNSRPGRLFGAEIHALIATARRGMDEALVERIYEARLLAETALSRPVMKAYKAMLRDSGLLDSTET